MAAVYRLERASKSPLDRWRQLSSCNESFSSSLLESSMVWVYGIVLLAVLSNGVIS